MYEIELTEVFEDWLSKLKDSRTVKIITARLERMRNGNLADFKHLKNASNIYELRIDYAKGYRIYFAKQNNKLIIILCAGDKKTQTKDINKAQEILKEVIKNDKNQKI
ncbi:MAG: type II toxin-antitoxin system RelE/ParE family toxin [Leptospirales bacterium]|nr:type II toxin-antitoxin system RelE/ParE family toxin [Leptospirales bacterium]